MALVWNGITITDWFHQGDMRPQSIIIKDWGFPFSIGSDFTYLGSGIDDDTCLKIYFFTEGSRLNAFYESTEVAIDNIITSLNAKTTKGTLTFGTYTYTDMMLVPNSLRLQGPAQKVIVNGTEKYIRPFICCFKQYRNT